MLINQMIHALTLPFTINSTFVRRHLDYNFHLLF